MEVSSFSHKIDFATLLSGNCIDQNQSYWISSRWGPQRIPIPTKEYQILFRFDMQEQDTDRVFDIGIRNNLVVILSSQKIYSISFESLDEAQQFYQSKITLTQFKKFMSSANNSPQSIFDCLRKMVHQLNFKKLK